MSEVVLHMAVSLDGYVEGPDRDLGWLIEDPELDWEPFIRKVGVILMGRRTYETALELGWPYEGMKSLVFSRDPSFQTSDERVPAYTKGVGRWLEEERPLLEGDAWVVGGAPLVRAFMDADAVDRMYLGIHPVVLGGGVPLFEQGTPRREFQTRAVDSYGRGLVLVEYERVR
jgi:dihydrofolate reductase